MQAQPLSRFALSMSVATAMLAGCGGSQPMTGAPSTGVQPATRSETKALKGYYRATFTTAVGSAPSSFCLQFMSSGHWSSTGSGGVNGTYLTSGEKLFASANWLPPPAVYLSLLGSVNAKQGSGTFIVTAQNGDANGGRTFTMTRAQKGCNQGTASRSFIGKTATL